MRNLSILGRKTVYKKDEKQAVLERLIMVWEKGVRPDAIALIEAITDESERLKMAGFFNALEARVMAQLVKDVMGKEPEPVDKKRVSVQKLS